MWLFIEALFKIAKTWEQPRYPSAGEQVTVAQPDNKISFSDKKKWAIEPQKDMEET